MKFFDKVLPLIIAQSVFVLIIISSVLVLKYFFKSTYLQVKNWYSQNVCVDTDINEVLSDEI